MSSTDYDPAKHGAGLGSTPVARDALVLIVNPRNPVRRLTAAEINAIARGRITNWRQVGWPNATIIVCGRTGPPHVPVLPREVPEQPGTDQPHQDLMPPTAWFARRSFATATRSATSPPHTSTPRCARCPFADRQVGVRVPVAHEHAPQDLPVRALSLVRDQGRAPAGQSKTFTTWVRGFSTGRGDRGAPSPALQVADAP